MGFSGEVVPERNQESSDLTVLGFPNLLDICGMDSFFVSFTVSGYFVGRQFFDLNPKSCGVPNTS